MRKRNTNRGFHTTMTGYVSKLNANAQKPGAGSALGDPQALESTFYRSTNKGKVPNTLPQFPAARDGHFAGIFDDCLFVFGGDRHLMAFNDLHYLNVNSLF